MAILLNHDWFQSGCAGSIQLILKNYTEDILTNSCLAAMTFQFLIDKREREELKPIPKKFHASSNEGLIIL